MFNQIEAPTTGVSSKVVPGRHVVYTVWIEEMKARPYDGGACLGPRMIDYLIIRTVHSVDRLVGAYSRGPWDPL